MATERKTLPFYFLCVFLRSGVYASAMTLRTIALPMIFLSVFWQQQAPPQRTAAPVLL